MYQRLTRFAVAAFSLLLAVSFLGLTFKKVLPERVAGQPAVKGKAVDQNLTPDSQGVAKDSFEVTGEDAWTCQTDRYDCQSFKTQAEAQLLFDYCRKIAGDIHQLDPDQNQVACESLP